MLVSFLFSYCHKYKKNSSTLSTMTMGPQGYYHYDVWRAQYNSVSGAKYQLLFTFWDCGCKCIFLQAVFLIPGMHKETDLAHKVCLIRPAELGEICVYGAATGKE